MKFADNAVAERLPEAALNSREKGIPGNVEGLPLGDVAARNWNLFSEDLPLPVAVIKTSALENNSAWMKAFTDDSNVRLAPHGKTTMCPTLFDLQLQDGAWALTVATPHQVQVARSFGYRRIVLANQLIGKSTIEWVITELEESPDFEFYCLVDSAENIQQLLRIARRKHLTRPLRVFVEMGFQGGRTGCRSVEQAVQIAHLIAQNSDVLALHGVEGFEGIIRGSDDRATIAHVDGFLDTIVKCAEECARQNLFAPGPVVLSAGSSFFFDRVRTKLSTTGLNRETIVLLRSGCYLIHDNVLFAHAFKNLKERTPNLSIPVFSLMPALEVWAYVQSLPEPGRAIATMGKRDVSYDDLPVPLKWYRPESGMQTEMPIVAGYSVSHLNDQHCYVNVPLDCPWRVGDMIGFGISHPCLTFDKWRVLHLVDDTYRITGSVRTYF